MNAPVLTPSDPRLTSMTLGDLMAGLGLPADARADVTRSCRKLSTLAKAPRPALAFSPYNPGLAITESELKQLISDRSSKAHSLLTESEIAACKAYLKRRKANPSYRPARAERTNTRGRGWSLA